MKPKCLKCNGCCDIVWIMPRRVYHCQFCNIYYDIIDHKLTMIDAKALTGISQEELDKMFYSKYDTPFK